MKKEYLIDAAAERVYQNQSEGYRKAFTEWRNAAKNRFGYSFVHDSREHTYVDGEGFADEQCRAAELRSLHACLQLLGSLMILYFLLEQLVYLAMKVMFEKPHLGWIYFSDRGIQPYVISDELYLYCSLRVLMAVAMIVIPLMLLRLPAKVVMPAEKQPPEKAVYLISVFFVAVIILHTADIGLCTFMGKLGIDSQYYLYSSGAELPAQVLYIAIEMVVIPILMEILFRGIILQLFRQFGDFYAIFIAALAQACCYHEPSKIMMMFLISALLGVVAIKSGNIILSMILRVVSLNLILFLNTLSNERYDAANLITSNIISIGVLMVAFTLMFAMRVRSKKPFVLEHDSTELTFKSKLRQFVNAPVAVIWFICVMLAMILSVEFV